MECYLRLEAKLSRLLRRDTKRTGGACARGAVVPWALCSSRQSSLLWPWLKSAVWLPVPMLTQQERLLLGLLEHCSHVKRRLLK